MCKREEEHPEFSTRIYAYKNLWFVIGTGCDRCSYQLSVCKNKGKGIMNREQTSGNFE
jgi:hypothetical protein